MTRHCYYQSSTYLFSGFNFKLSHPILIQNKFREFDWAFLPSILDRSRSRSPQHIGSSWYLPLHLCQTSDTIIQWVRTITSLPPTSHSRLQCLGIWNFRVWQLDLQTAYKTPQITVFPAFLTTKRDLDCIPRPSCTVPESLWLFWVLPKCQSATHWKGSLLYRRILTVNQSFSWSQLSRFKQIPCQRFSLSALATVGFLLSQHIQIQCWWVSKISSSSSSAIIFA